MSEYAITTSGLTKRYGSFTAVDDLALQVREGEIYGFLGRNGAGKTTTIRMLLGLIRPTAGEVWIRGTRVAPGANTALADVGFLVESASAYPNLTVTENLTIARRLHGASPGSVDAVIDRLSLGPYAHRRAGKLSLGNKQRLSLARALLHTPRVLLLDEPANGLDPAGIVEIRHLLQELAREHGVTVFMSSHILAEVAHLADRIGIVHNGRLIEESTRADLATRAREHASAAMTPEERADALLTMDLERYFLWRTDEGAAS